MFSRLAFQSMHLRLSLFPITQIMNRNNAIGIPFFRLIFYVDTFFVHPFFFAERSKQTQFHPLFFAERSKQTHFHPFFKADMTVEPSKMGQGHIDLLWDLAMKEQMVLSTKGSMTSGTLEFQLKRGVRNIRHRNIRPPASFIHIAGIFLGGFLRLHFFVALTDRKPL